MVMKLFGYFTYRYFFKRNAYINIFTHLSVKKLTANFICFLKEKRKITKLIHFLVKHWGHGEQWGHFTSNYFSRLFSNCIFLCK